MAQPFVADLGTVQHSSTSPCNLTLSTGVAAGDEIIVFILIRSAVVAASGVSDTGGNTYTKMGNSVGATTKDVEIWRAAVTTPLSAGNTISVAFAGSLNLVVGAAVFRDVTNSTDKSHATAGTSTTPSDTLTAATAQRTVAACVLGLTSSFGSEVTVSTPDAEYTQLHYIQHTLSDIAMYTGYRVVNPSQTSTFDPVISSSVSWRVIQCSFPWPIVGGQDRLLTLGVT